MLACWVLKDTQLTNQYKQTQQLKSYAPFYPAS